MNTPMNKTLPLLPGTPQEEPEKGVKMRSEDHDEVMLRWVDSESTGRHRVRVAKYRNGHRGLQFVRFAPDGLVEASSSMLLNPEQYYQLAQCVFRDSQLIKELCTRFPRGTDETVDKIRDFVNIAILV